MKQKLLQEEGICYALSWPRKHFAMILDTRESIVFLIQPSIERKLPSKIEKTPLWKGKAPIGVVWAAIARVQVQGPICKRQTKEYFHSWELTVWNKTERTTYEANNLIFFPGFPSFSLQWPTFLEALPSLYLLCYYQVFFGELERKQGNLSTNFE